MLTSTVDNKNFFWQLVSQIGPFLAKDNNWFCTAKTWWYAY